MEDLPWTLEQKTPWAGRFRGGLGRWFGLKTSPGTNAIGYVSCVVLKSLCPRFANSASNETEIN